MLRKQVNQKETKSKKGVNVGQKIDHVAKIKIMCMKLLRRERDRNQ